MFRSKLQLTASEAKLPEQCRGYAIKARKRSQRVRIQIALLLVLYTAWAGFQVVGSIVNARRESNNAFARELSNAVTSYSYLKSMRSFCMFEDAHSRLAICFIDIVLHVNVTGGDE